MVAQTQSGPVEHVKVKVPPCPTSVSVDNITPKSLPDYEHPTWLTGVGILSRMKVAGPDNDYTGAELIETVTPQSNTCPASIASYTSFPTIKAGDTPPFKVGAATVWEGQDIPSVLNTFYDSHKSIADQNILLDGLGRPIVQSCVATAVQTYSCNGSVIGTFTLTNTYTLGTGTGTLNGQSVTNVTTNKQ